MQNGECAKFDTRRPFSSADGENLRTCTYQQDFDITASMEASLGPICDKCDEKT